MAGEALGAVPDELPDDPVPDDVEPPLTLLAPLAEPDGTEGKVEPSDGPAFPPVVGVVDVPPPPPHPLSSVTSNAPSTHSLFLLNPATTASSFLSI